MLWRHSEHTWQRHSLSGFLALFILLSSSSHWWRVGRGPQPLKIGIAKGPEQSILTTLCPAWSLVSLTPCRHWWGMPHPALHRKDKSRKGVAAPQGALHTAKRETPKACPTKVGAGNSLLSSPDRGGMDSDGYSMVSEAQSTCYHRKKQWGESIWHPHIWIC